MRYLAYCDGSVQGNKVYSSYVIYDEKNNVMDKKVFRIQKIEKPKSDDAEFMALYTLLKHLKENKLDIKNGKILMDAKFVILQYAGLSERLKKHYDYRTMIINKIGLDNYYDSLEAIEWRPRELNYADSVIRYMKSKDNPERLTPIGFSRYKKPGNDFPVDAEHIKKVIEMENITGKFTGVGRGSNPYYISIPGTDYVIEQERLLLYYQKEVFNQPMNRNGMNEANTDEFLSSLTYVINNMVPYQDHYFHHRWRVRTVDNTIDKVIVVKTKKEQKKIKKSIARKLRLEQRLEKESKKCSKKTETKQPKTIEVEPKETVELKPVVTASRFKNIPGTKYFIHPKTLKMYKKTLCKTKYDTNHKVMLRLSKTIKNANIENGVIACKSLHLLSDKNVINDWVFYKKRWNIISIDEINSETNFLNKAHVDFVDVPRTNFTMSPMLVKIMRKKLGLPSEAEMEQNQVLEIISTKLHQSQRIAYNGFDVYVDGNSHIIVANGIIQDHIMSDDFLKTSKQNVA